MQTGCLQVCWGGLDTLLQIWWRCAERHRAAEVDQRDIHWMTPGKEEHRCTQSSCLIGVKNRGTRSQSCCLIGVKNRSKRCQKQKMYKATQNTHERSTFIRTKSQIQQWKKSRAPPQGGNTFWIHQQVIIKWLSALYGVRVRGTHFLFLSKQK